jgi:membrane associated rhomboid family serine protease
MPFRLTPIVKGLLIATFAGFLFQHTIDQYFGGNITGLFGFIPGEFISRGRIWQALTFPFLHADLGQFFLNMLMLAFMGSELESIWKPKRFVLYLWVCSLAAAFVYLVFAAFDGAALRTPLLGMTAAVYGMIVAYGLIFGERTMLFMMVIPMKAKHFAMILAGVQVMTTLFSPGAKLTALAHLAGMAGGFVFLVGNAYLKMRRSNRSPGVSRTRRAGEPGTRARKAGGHLKLIINNARDFNEDPEDGPKTWH